MTFKITKFTYVFLTLLLLLIGLLPIVVGMDQNNETKISLEQTRSQEFFAPITEFNIDGTDTSYLYHDGTSVQTYNDGITTGHRVQHFNSDNYTHMSILEDNTMRYEKYLISDNNLNDLIGSLDISLDSREITVENQKLLEFSFSIQGLLENDPYSPTKTGSVIDFEGSVRLKEDFSYKSSKLDISLQSGDLAVFIENNDLNNIDLIPGFSIKHTLEKLMDRDILEINTTSMINSDNCNNSDFTTDPSCYRTSSTIGVWDHSLNFERYSLHHIFDIMNEISPIFNSTFHKTNDGYTSATNFEYSDPQFRRVEETGLSGFNSYTTHLWDVNITSLTKQSIIESIDTSIINGIFSSLRLSDYGLEIELLSNVSGLTKVESNFLRHDITIDHFDKNGINRFSGTFKTKEDATKPLSILEYTGYDHFDSQITYPTDNDVVLKQATTFSKFNQFDNYELTPNLVSLGSMSQLMQLDLQKGLQKTQQNLQMMSNISKQSHDTAKSVIRKIGGYLDQESEVNVFDTITPQGEFVLNRPPIFIGDGFPTSDPRGKDIIPIPTPSNYQRPSLKINVTKLIVNDDNIQLGLKAINQYNQEITVQGEILKDYMFYSKISQTNNEIEMVIPKDFESSISIKLHSLFLPIGELTLTRSQIDQFEPDAFISEITGERPETGENSNMNNLEVLPLVFVIPLLLRSIIRREMFSKQ